MPHNDRLLVPYMYDKCIMNTNIISIQVIDYDLWYEFKCDFPEYCSIKRFKHKEVLDASKWILVAFKASLT